MRITAIHSIYSSASVSGENIAVELQTRALSEAGHNIDLYTRSTDALLDSRGYRLGSALRVMTGIDIGHGSLPKPEGNTHALILHNLFPNFGTNWIKEWPGPVVTVIHNYRYVCANGLLLREGAPCTLCLNGSSWPAIRHGCYRGSALATVPLAIANLRPLSRVTPLARADAVVAQSEQSKALFQRIGLSEDRLHYIPGFTENFPPNEGEPEKSWAFVGRLSAEKGLDTLLRDWPNSETLDVIGSGDDEPQLKELAGDNVTFLGALDHDDVLRLLGNYRGLVFPGVCWEGAHPMVVREALALGVPVVAAVGSAAADLIASFGGGVTYGSGDPRSLLSALSAIRENGMQMRVQARSTALTVFSKQVWQARMSSVLNGALTRCSTLG